MQVVYIHFLRKQVRKRIFTLLVNYCNKKCKWYQRCCWTGKKVPDWQQQLCPATWEMALRNRWRWKTRLKVKSITCNCESVFELIFLILNVPPTCRYSSLLTGLGDTRTGKMVPCVVKSLRNKVLSFTDSREDSVRGRDSTITFTPLNKPFQIIMRSRQWDT